MYKQEFVMLVAFQGGELGGQRAEGGGRLLTGYSFVPFNFKPYESITY